ncbi:MAG: response regulator transcription factor [Aureisphaera sp.]
MGYKKEDISIVLADDHPLLLKGLYEELTEHNYNVIGQASDGVKAIELILTHKPKLALLDIEMPMLNAFEIFKIVQGKRSDTKFILLSYHKEKEIVQRAKALKIPAYLLKEDSFFTIEACIKAVMENKTFYSPSLSSELLDHSEHGLKLLNRLTASEFSILKRISQNQSSKAIAAEIGVSVRTIDKHRANIINKLGLAKGTNSLSIWAVMNKDIIAGL